MTASLWCRISRRNDSLDYDEIIAEWRSGPISSISSTVRSIFNYYYGDSYIWPADNITPEELDCLFDAGQRAFVFRSSGNEYIVNLRLDSFETQRRRIDEAMAQSEEKVRQEAKLARLQDALDDFRITARNIINGHADDVVHDLKEVLEYYKDIEEKLCPS